MHTTTIFCRLRRSLLLLTVAAIALVLISAPYSNAITLPETEHSAFLNDFSEGYRAGKTHFITNLIKENQRKVRPVVRTLIEEAKNRDYNERMELLDIANAIAAMHKHWNYDEEPLKEVEAVLKAELEREQARAAEAAKWAAFEKYPGNLLFRTNPESLERNRVAPVVFAHWKHRLLFECSACHDSLFSIDRSASAMTPATAHKKEFCGACHDSKTAFGLMNYETDCIRCHNTETEENKQVYTAKYDLGLSSKKAGQLGGKLGKLKDGKLPEDRFGDINWVELGNSGAYKPVSKKMTGAEKSSSAILFEVPPAAAWIGAVPFRHKQHSPGIECSTCHSSLYAKKAGGSKHATMESMADGKSCGACHNKVSFKLADCMRCHTNGLSDEELGKMLKRDTGE